jgi:hypothetical protein
MLLETGIGFDVYSEESKSQYAEVMSVIDLSLKMGIPVVAIISYGLNAYHAGAILGSGASHMLLKSQDEDFPEAKLGDDIRLDGSWDLDVRRKSDRSVVNDFVKFAREWHLIEVASCMDVALGDNKIIFASEVAIKYIAIECDKESGRNMLTFEFPKVNDFRDTLEQEISKCGKYKGLESLFIEIATIGFNFAFTSDSGINLSQELPKTIKRCVSDVLRSSGNEEAINKADEIELDLKI